MCSHKQTNFLSPSPIQFSGKGAELFAKFNKFLLKIFKKYKWLSLLSKYYIDIIVNILC